MNYPLYAEGFYRALHKVSEIGVPIYVTENGVADRKIILDLNLFQNTFMLCTKL